MYIHTHTSTETAFLLLLLLLLHIIFSLNPQLRLLLLSAECTYKNNAPTTDGRALR